MYFVRFSQQSHEVCDYHPHFTDGETDTEVRHLLRIMELISKHRDSNTDVSDSKSNAIGLYHFVFRYYNLVIQSTSLGCARWPGFKAQCLFISLCDLDRDHVLIHKKG